MNDQDEPQECCAHRKIVYKRVDHSGGTCSDSWLCADCGIPFWPNAALAAERKLLAQQIEATMMARLRASEAEKQLAAERKIKSAEKLILLDEVAKNKTLVDALKEFEAEYPHVTRLLAEVEKQ